MPPNDTERTLGRLLQFMETATEWQGQVDKKLDSINKQLQTRHECYQVERIEELEQGFTAWKVRARIAAAAIGFFGIVAGTIIKMFAVKGD